MTTLAVTIHIDDGRHRHAAITATVMPLDPALMSAIAKVTAAADRLDQDMHTYREQDALWALYTAALQLRHASRTNT